MVARRPADLVQATIRARNPDKGRLCARLSHGNNTDSSISRRCGNRLGYGHASNEERVLCGVDLNGGLVRNDEVSSRVVSMMMGL